MNYIRFLCEQCATTFEAEPGTDAYRVPVRIPVGSIEFEFATIQWNPGHFPCVELNNRNYYISHMEAHESSVHFTLLLANPPHD